MSCEYEEKCERNECLMTLGDYSSKRVINSKHNDESGEDLNLRSHKHFSNEQPQTILSSPSCRETSPI